MNSLLLTMVLMIAPAPEPAMTLVEAGRPVSSIVTADDASDTVRRAAEELADTIRRMSGAKLPIASEGKARRGRRIDVGLTCKARSHLPEGFADDAERVLIRTVPDGLLICGGSDRGTLFAVYRFLEVLGCRWLTPEPENEVIPHQSTVTVPSLAIDTQPAFQWRLFGGSRPELERWGVRMGMNGLYTEEAAGRNGACLYWPPDVSGVHTFQKLMPNERYFKAHPEWYPLLRGRRAPGKLHNAQLCVTAPGLADEFAANVIRVFDEDPRRQLVSISPNDGYGWCTCPACTELDRKLCGGRTTKQGLSGAKPFRGDRVFWFANEVARRVAKKYPNKKLLVLAYVNYAEPPDTIRPLPNVVPFLCHYAPADYAHAINDPASEPNRQFNELLKRWARITPEVMIYSYVSKSMWWRLPRPVLRPFAADIKHFHELGIRRYYCQSSLTDWPLDGPLYYVIGRLLWDPSADPKEIAGEWIRQMFGPAAPEMSAYYDAVDTAVRTTGRSYSDSPPRDVPGLYDRKSFDAAMAALERAEKVPADQRVKHRIAEVAQTFRYGYRMVEAIEKYHRFCESGDPELLEAAAATGREALEYRKVRESARLIDSWAVFSELGVPASGFGKAETKDGHRCWNSDETGPGDQSHGWASFIIRVPDTKKPVNLEIDVWGTSQLGGIVVNTKRGVWTPVRPQKRISGKPQWETLVWHIPPEAMDQTRVGQRVGFGGADSQVWIAEIRAKQP